MGIAIAVLVVDALLFVAVAVFGIVVAVRCGGDCGFVDFVLSNPSILLSAMAAGLVSLSLASVPILVSDGIWAGEITVEKQAVSDVRYEDSMFYDSVIVELEDGETIVTSARGVNDEGRLDRDAKYVTLETSRYDAGVCSYVKYRLLEEGDE